MVEVPLRTAVAVADSRIAAEAEVLILEVALIPVREFLQQW
jgi:hypothetical protein